MQSGFAGAYRDRESCRDVVEREIRPVMENDDGAFLHGQARDRTKDLVTREDARERVDRLATYPVERDESNELATSKPIAAGVHDDAIQPRPEAILVAQIRKRSPRLRKGVLHGVFGVHRVPEDQARDAIGAIQSRSREEEEPSSHVVCGCLLGAGIGEGTLRHHNLQTSEEADEFSGGCSVPSPPLSIDAPAQRGLHFNPDEITRISRLDP